jgi:vacuolar-type H+-ATPase subunit H
MSTAELKLKVINRITNITDNNLIEQIHRLIDFELEKGVYELSEEQTQRIAEAKEEYQKGETFTNEEAIKEIEKWLDEK